MLTFLLVIQAIVAVLLVGVILMQQSEGGGLGMGGSPTGLMSARGAADFLTRATTILAAIFIALSILHAVLATQHNRGGDIDTSLAKTVAPTAPTPAPSVPIGGAPAPGAATGAPALAPTPAPATNTVPMATAHPKVEQRTERPQRAPAPRPVTTSVAPPAVTTTVAPAASAPAPTNSN
jgi:preprotein translocase subunit SecG